MSVARIPLRVSKVPASGFPLESWVYAGEIVLHTHVPQHAAQGSVTRFESDPTVQPRTRWCV